VAIKGTPGAHAPKAKSFCALFSKSASFFSIILRMIREDIRQLTGLRGVAALSVALVHLGFMRFAVVRFWEFHDQAVDLFFCLSGFTLCLVYQAGERKTLPFRRYAVARFARIYPLYAVILLFCWWLTIRHLAGAAIYPENLFVADAIRNVLLLNAWPVIGDGADWDSPAWSLSVEVFCYLAVLPALFAASGFAERSPPALRAFGVLVLAGISFVAFSRYWDVQILVPRLYTAANPIGYWIPMVRGVTLFTAGWLAHGFWRRRAPLALAAGELCDVTAAAAVLVLACGYLGLLPKAALVFLAAPLVLGLAENPAAWTARALASPPLHFLGEISYAVYLLHEPLQSALQAYVPYVTTHPLRGQAITLLALFFVATLSYYGFEKPARLLLKRGFGGPRLGHAAGQTP